MYACMHVHNYMYVHMYVSLYVCMHACVCMYVYVYLYVCIYVCIIKCMYGMQRYACAYVYVIYDMYRMIKNFYSKKVWYSKHTRWRKLNIGKLSFENKRLQLADKTLVS